MGLKADELQHGCFARAEADEPMFVLLSRDRLAPLLVRAWAGLRTLQIWIGLKPASDYVKVDEARQLAARMTQWRAVDRFAPATVRLARLQHAESETFETFEALETLYVSAASRSSASAVMSDALIPPGTAPRPPLRLLDLKPGAPARSGKPAVDLQGPFNLRGDFFR